MSLTLQNRQEDLSIAYISAIAAKAGYDCGRPGKHDYGVDLEIIPVIDTDGKKQLTGTPLYIQAKASYNFTINDECISYDLKVNNYNMLIREDLGLPIILVLYCMPRNDNEWLSVYDMRTVLKNCGYWMSLSGCPPHREYKYNKYKNTKKTTVY